MIRYAIVLLDDPELLGYIDCEIAPTAGMVLEAFEGTDSMLLSVPESHFSFHALH